MSAVYAEIARELERRDFAQFSDECIHVFSDEFVQKMEIIADSFNRRKSALTGKKRLVFAAALIAALLFGALCACAVYKKYFHYITDCGVGSFIRFDFDDYYDGYADPTIPSYLETYYSPAYIPDGYTIDDIHKTDISYHLTYAQISENTCYIHYQQHHLSSHFMVDTEDADVSYIKRNGIRYFCVRKNDTVYLSWTDNSYAFTLCIIGFSDTDEALKIAESLAAE